MPDEVSQALAILSRELPKVAAAARRMDNPVLEMLLSRAENELHKTLVTRCQATMAENDDAVSQNHD